MYTYLGENAGCGKDDMSPVSADGIAEPYKGTKYRASACLSVNVQPISYRVYTREVSEPQDLRALSPPQEVTSPL